MPQNKDPNAKQKKHSGPVDLRLLNQHGASFEVGCCLQKL